MKRFGKGFTLVEIMIVVAIIGLLAAIAIPNLLRARVNANESASIAAMRTLSTALEGFRANTGAYPTTAAGLAALISPTSVPAYIDSLLAGATAAASARQGYYYAYAQVDNNSYTLTATPATANVTGVRVFFVDQTGVIRLNNAAGNPIQ